MPDLIGIDKGVDELTTKTLPELLAGLNALADRLESLLRTLDGATITVTLGHPAQGPPTP